MTPRILIIAGSDSSGGAGIQADMKTVTMLGGFATTAITAVTAQNTLGVQAVHAIPPEMVIAQIDSVIDDIGIDAVKIGMIGSSETVNAVADRLATVTVPIVFDPVMVATSGAILVDGATIAAFTRLIGLATLVTPNLPEYSVLNSALASANVLLKGGHGDGDILCDRLLGSGGEIASWCDARIETRNTHGTGCTLASAIAVGLAQGMPMIAAIERARAFVRAAIDAAPGFGAGHGPMGHHSMVGTFQRDGVSEESSAR